MLLPEYVQIEPVGQCNLQCKMCPIQFRDTGSPYAPPAFMPLDTFANLLAQFVNVRHLHLQGMGEPMLHPRFFDMVRLAKARGIRVTTNTNLTVLDAEACMRSGLNELHGSLDGARAETYERIRPGARFARALRNISRLITVRERARSDHPRVELVLVLMRDNVRELPDWVRLGHRLGVDSLFVQQLCHEFGEEALPRRYAPMRQFVDSQMIQAMDADPCRDFLEEARVLADGFRIPLRLPRLDPRREAVNMSGRSRCDWPWRGAYVSYTGEAMPCCMISTPDRLNFGNMVNNGVAATWNGGDYAAFRARLESNDPPEVCRSCSLYNGTF